jgi:hypothetical protein
MAAQCFNIAPNGLCDAWILHLMVAQCFDIVPDGWRRDAWISRLMAARCYNLAAGRFDIAPNGGAMP